MSIDERTKDKYEVTRLLDYNLLKVGDTYEVDDDDDDVSLGNGKFVHVRKIENESSPGKPGTYKLIPSRFESITQVPFAPVLEKNLDYIAQIDLVSSTRKFFGASDRIKEMGLIPRRGTLLYGSPGCGKTHQLNNAVIELTDENTASYIVSLDELTPGHLIAFFRVNRPDPSVKRLIIVIEDLGGAEVDPEAAARISSSGLLSFLDGTQGAWPVPTAIFATTNYPQNFLANLIDRPGRFDEVIEIQPPTEKAIIQYMSELMKRPLTEDEISGLYYGITTAHAKEAVLRHTIYGDTLASYLDKMRLYSEKAKRNFEKDSIMGL